MRAEPSAKNAGPVARTIAAVAALACSIALSSSACAPGGAAGPQGRAEATCQAECARGAGKTCDEHGCDRGCRFILDRLVERKGPHVIACVARARACDDEAWADCAARVGPHADGGPPAPAPAEEEEL